MREDLSSAGMDKEEEYFYRQNKKLIDKRRAELEEKRAEQRKRELKEQHWMRCPKCGDEMEEIDLAGVKIDKCGGCNGVFFDEGELNIILEAQLPEGFLAGMKKKLFGG